MRAGGLVGSNALPRPWLATALLTILLSASPSVAQVAQIVTPEDTPSHPVSLRINGLDEARPISFSVRSSNSALVPENHVHIRRTGHEASMFTTPALNETGAASLFIHATDGITTITQLVNVTVTAANDAPTLARIADQVIPESGSTAPISFMVGDVETPAASLIVTARSSDPGLLPNETIVLSGSGALRTMTAKPIEGRSGTVRATIVVSDGEAATSRDFEIRVGTVNHAPIANAGPDQTLVATNATNLNGTATDDRNDRLTILWHVVAGPSDVDFANPSSLNTAVRFTTHGLYTLGLSVSDGDLTDSDEVTLFVAAGAVAGVQEAVRKRR